MTSYDDLAGRVDRLEAELRELRAVVTGAGPRFGAIYPEFQERFRGSAADVTGKLAAYLPEARRVVRDGGVVDVGSGRGEWLTLLREAGVPAHGVDANAARVESARQRGLDVVLGDAVAHLRSLPPESVDMVTAFHVVEHLDTESLLGLLEVARCVLRPAGLLVVETPSPNNLSTAARDFYTDPTHRRPLPPELMAHLVAAAGCGEIEVRYLHPKPSPFPGDGEAAPSPLLQRVVEDALFGPQDYAVLGVKVLG